MWEPRRISTKRVYRRNHADNKPALPETPTRTAKKKNKRRHCAAVAKTRTRCSAMRRDSTRATRFDPAPTVHQLPACGSSGDYFVGRMSHAFF